MAIKSKPTNRELLQIAIDEELEKAIDWALKNKDNLDLYSIKLLGGHLTLKPMKDILEMYKNESK